MLIGESWRRYPDTHEVVARYPGSCVECRTPWAVGATIVGTRRDGWICAPCSEEFGPTTDPTPWALPVGARSFALKYPAVCCHCQCELAAGSGAWPNVMGGWSCPACKDSVAPTWWGVLTKAEIRISEGTPVSLSLADYKVLSANLGKRTDLAPARRGDESAWSKVRSSGPGLTLASGWQLTDLNDAYGLVDDAIEYRFNPNLSTDQFLQLARAIEDPTSTNPGWGAIFRDRGIEAPVRGPNTELPRAEFFMG